MLPLAGEKTKNLEPRRKSVNYAPGGTQQQPHLRHGRERKSQLYPSGILIVVEEKE
jgi:hypothetical protein